MQVPDERLNEASRTEAENLGDEEIQQMLALASRLREMRGGELDDDAILAVAEATGAPVSYVRLAVHHVPKPDEKLSFVQSVKRSFLAYSPDVRRWVTSAVLGLGAGVFWYLAGTPRPDNSGLPEVLSATIVLLGLYNCSLARSHKTALLAGALLGAVSQVTVSLFAYVAGLFMGPTWSQGPEVFTYLAITLAFALMGGSSAYLVDRFRKRLGLSDPNQDRHVLLQQLLDIQTKLRSDEQNATFLSLDIVGSTRIKSTADPLAVEFTFNEYHRFVESLVNKHGGQIHSTAGDGVTAVFDSSPSAYSAGKAVLAGLFEFNSMRNELGEPIRLRGGIHSGIVLAPGKDSTAVNFAHVIDVAAHLQKLAPEGALVVSRAAASPLGGLGAVSAEHVKFDDVDGAVWRPKTKVSAMPSSASQA